MSGAAQRGAPAFSVVIPVRNMAGTIGDQLAALARQRFEPCLEVIVADNASTDGSAARAAQWADRLPGLRIVDASRRPGAAHARNEGARASRAGLLAFCDADDVVGDRWVEAMAGALAAHPVVGGSCEMHSRNAAGIAALYPTYTAEPADHSKFLPFAQGGNLGVRREVFDALGGFAPELRTGEDVDFAWRAQLAGYRLQFEPGAVVHRSLRKRPVSFFLQQVGYGRAMPRLYQRYRVHGMERGRLRDPVYDAYLLLARLPDLCSPHRRYGWLQRAGWRAGRTLGSLECGVFYP